MTTRRPGRREFLKGVTGSAAAMAATAHGAFAAAAGEGSVRMDAATQGTAAARARGSGSASSA
jgi:hypothetical protein